MNLTVGSYCSGAAIVECGFEQAGFQSLFTVEKDARLAGLAKLNHPESRCITGDVCNIGPTTLPTPNVFWASPPCTNASRPGGSETEGDIAIAKAICRFLSHHKPPAFCLENVPKYRNFRAFGEIVGCLYKLGYWPHWEVYDFSLYGVPQERKRLILIAGAKGIYIPKPATLWRKVGWFDALKDLIWTEFPEVELAPWQQPWVEAALAEGEASRPLLVQRDGASGGKPAIREAWQAAPTVRAMGGDRHCWPFDVVANGRTYRVSPRGLARLQGIPNNFQLPTDPKLALRAIGRAVPPPFGCAVGESVKAAIQRVEGGAIAA